MMVRAGDPNAMPDDSPVTCRCGEPAFCAYSWGGPLVFACIDHDPAAAPVLAANIAGHPLDYRTLVTPGTLRDGLQPSLT